MEAFFLHLSIVEGEKARETTHMKEKEETFKVTFTIATLITKMYTHGADLKQT